MIALSEAFEIARKHISPNLIEKVVSIQNQLRKQRDSLTCFQYGKKALKQKKKD